MKNRISQTSIKKVMKENKHESYCLHDMVRAFNLDVNNQETRSQMSWALHALNQKGWLRKVGKDNCMDNLKAHTFYQYKNKYKKRKGKAEREGYKQTKEHKENIRKSVLETIARKKELLPRIGEPEIKAKPRLIAVKEVQTIKCPFCKEIIYITEA